ncbi:Putative protein in type-1 retrotransposable element R1DM [Araneus ventricosus]|uniref:Retrovirus-related Pol polyprotein from type-1 retrotransposable element R1 n=1 Tax=Araneus ventricosus TaxID=182803 RepID=A0A4Y2H5D8_ARAVE|nr:Putative protein in type-1 retrotransposable element R1DM [Araneus ventricosus]
MLLGELADFNFYSSFNLLIGDFNCKSSNWGYVSDNTRGRKLTEFIASNNLHVCNIADYGPTFHSSIHVGFPDLTIISAPILNYVKNWGVLDTESHRDHKYIYFKIELDDIPETDFHFKSKYNQGRFQNYIRKHLKHLKDRLVSIDNTIYLNELFIDLVELVSKGAFKTLKKKPKRYARKFGFWNEDLRRSRNNVNKLFKIYSRHKVANLDSDLIQSSDHNNIIHNNQFGFREGRSCDLAIQNIVDIIREKTHHIALISLDIKSAFDNMNWSVLFKLFDDLNFPKFFRNFIFHYLNNRTVSFSSEIENISRTCFRGCPQGSVVAPTIWNIYINPILERNNISFYIQAFADDLALIISGRTARELESNTNIALAEIAQHLHEIKLSLSVHKCQALVFRSVSSQKFSKRNSTTLNRKPTFRINNFSIKISDSLKILGMVLDNKLTWTAHISSLYGKILSLTSNFNRVIKSDWSMNRNILKVWYFTVIEKDLLYGASIWGGALTEHHISRLHSFQRVFLLLFTRAYKTTSTNVLNVLTGIPPLHITAKTEFCKFQIWVRHSPLYNHIINNIPLDYNIDIRNIPSEQKSIVLSPTIQEADFEVYTDGSRIDNETGLAVCTFQQNNNISNFLFKLNSYNSVFQAELETIQFACNWALQNNFKIIIHTHSLSSILAIQSANSRSGFVHSVKQDIFRAKHLVGLSWVKAHVGIPVNEWADQQAKSAINLGVEKLIPAPRSFLRRTLKQQILSEWNDYFMNYNSASGREPEILLIK